MKRMDFFCTSQASTAICSNADQHSIVPHHNKPPTHQHHQPTSPHLRHELPRKLRTSVPCSSQLPITPRRSTSYTQISVPCPSQPPITPRRSTSYTKISVPCSSQLPITPRRSTSYTQRNHNSSSKELLINDRRKSSADVTDVSSRQLLSDAPFFELLSNSDRIKPPRITTTRSLSISSSNHGAPRLLKSFLLSPDHGKPLVSTPKITTDQRLSTSTSIHSSPRPLKSSSLSTHDRIKQLASIPKLTTTHRLSITPTDHDLPHPLQSSLSTPRPSRDQVVELRVSLHCKGCEGKVKKHISRMEGVKSFTIDFTNKKVTIIGDVIPLEVLASVSKVKNAQFWPSTSSSSSSSSSSSLFSGQDQPDLLL